MDRVLDCFVWDTGLAQRLDVPRADLVRMERQLLDELEGGPQLGADGRRAPVVQDRLDQLVIVECQRRDRAVRTRSEDALVEP